MLEITVMQLIVNFSHIRIKKVIADPMQPAGC